MVNKGWCQQAVRKWFCRRAELPSGRCFSETKWQKQVRLWYLLYRWFIFLAWITIILCSFLELGSYKPLGNVHLWPIYLTNWDLLLGAGQSLLGVVLVTRRWKLQRSCQNFEPYQLPLGKCEKVYWFLHVVTTSMALGVTATYWFAVYNPEIHFIDPLNVMLHVCNSVLILLDFFIVGVPFILRHFWWCMTVVVCYLVFSVVYFAAGGLDKHGYHYIYKILDWEKPLRTLLVCLGGLAFTMALHCLLCLTAALRDHVYKHCCGIGLQEIDKKYMESNENQKNNRMDVTGRSNELIV